MRDYPTLAEQLVELANRFRAARDVATWIKLDIAFHRALARSAHNSVLSEVYNSITGLLFQHFKYYPLSWAHST